VQGQGEEGKVIDELEGISLDECKEACVELNGCFFAFIKTDPFKLINNLPFLTLSLHAFKLWP
jgi:hypothetical protein